MWIYIVVAVGSMIVAFIIAHTVEVSSAAAKKKTDKGFIASTDSSDVMLDDSVLRQSIFTEISDLVDSQQRGREITKAVSRVVGKELDKRVKDKEQEVTHKYERVLQEKTQNEEIALKKYKKVLVEKKSTDAVIRSIAEGLVVVDSEGKVVMMNPAAEKLLGVEKQDKVGHPITENLKSEQLVSLAQGTPEQEGKEIELRSSQEETKKILRASSAVIENEHGHTVGMVSVLSDITKQKELDRLKANFIASISHELRTPLIAIDKSVTLLLSKETGSLSEPQEQFLSIAARNLKRLTTLINDLLDMSKLEAKRMKLDRQPTVLLQLIDETLETFSNWAKSKSVKINKVVEGNIPEVIVDPGRIIQVLNNLIGNALKFTPSGGDVTIEATLDSDSVKVSVEDTGVGIPTQDLSKIFDKFYQSSERAPSDVSGTGLGLSICKEIVKIHGGKIWAESEKGKGARFNFTLPLKS